MSRKQTLLCLLLASLLTVHACPPGQGRILGIDGTDEVPDLIGVPGCKIGMNNGDLGTNQPLLIDPKSGQLVLPSKQGFVNVEPGDSVNFYCNANFASPIGGNNVTISCNDNEKLIYNKKEITIQEIQCSTSINRMTLKTDRTCYNGATVFEIGFTTDTGFLSRIEICHDETTSITHYARYSMYPSSAAFQTAVGRPNFVKGGVYTGVDIDQLYAQKNQEVDIGKMLGVDPAKYFNVPKNLYLARGHLAAKADFIYAPEQMATFYYFNSAPAWQVFNAGNWGRAEDGLRKFAASRDLNLDVICGVWGISTLPNAKGKQTAVYLGYGRDGKPIIPVPKIFYKIAIDRATQKGVVLIGVNNPFATLKEIQTNYIICKDISDKIDWITWEKTNIEKGYSYACDVNDFLAKVKEVPALTVNGLLY